VECAGNPPQSDVVLCMKAYMLHTCAFIHNLLHACTTQVARIFESTEAEAVLLQMGAHDPEAAAFPIPDQFSKTSNHSACSGGSSMLQVHKTAPLVTLPQGSGSRHPETGNDRTIEGDCSWGDSLWPRSGSGLSSRMMVAAAVVGLGLAAVYSLHRSRVGAQ